MEQKQRLAIIDGNMIIHRAYHALPPFKTKKGELVNAVYGFLLAFFRVVSEFKPDYIVAAFDNPKPTFRHKEFKEYKGKRPPTPIDLSSQIPRTKEMLKDFGISFFEKEGFEADDIIGTISSIVSRDFGNNKLQGNVQAVQLIPMQLLVENKKNDLSKLMETIIFSGDLDVLQLIDENTKVCALRNGLKKVLVYNEDTVRERYGINVSQLIDFKALRGDPSDNIPGVAGIGEKTAISLLQSFGVLENIYYAIENNTESALKNIKLSIKEKLITDKRQAFLSKKLVTIKRDVPIDFKLTDCSFANYNRDKAEIALRDIGFLSLINKLPISLI